MDLLNPKDLIDPGPFARRFEQLGARYLPEILRLVDEVLAESLPPGSSVGAMCSYHLQTGGKRLRALLPLLVAETLGHDPARLVPFGAACEMLHNATLVHDDLQDGDVVRRGLPTVWRRYGAAQAVNCGDAMFYLTLLLVQKLDVPPGLGRSVIRRVLLDTLRVIDGQERELALRELEQPALAQYIAMVEGKTSGLFSLPMAGSAEICGASPEATQALEGAALHLGVLFQIQDDVLDLYGEKGRDRAGSDIAEGKRSVLVLHALSCCSPEEASWLRQVLDKPRAETTPADVEAVAALFSRTGSLRHALGEIARRLKQALAVTAPYPQLAELVGGLAALMARPIRPLLDAAAELEA